jgi:hypothetical protein
MPNDSTGAGHHSANPTPQVRSGDTPDLTHVHPDHLRLGGTGIFAGDWARYDAGGGRWRIPVGFVGTLVDRWNGWAVFRCGREVAAAIKWAELHSVQPFGCSRLSVSGRRV